MRNLYRLKVTDRGTEVFTGHAVADSPFLALGSIAARINDTEGALFIEVELMGAVAITGELDKPADKPDEVGTSTNPL